MSTLAYTVINDADPTAPVLILGNSLGTVQGLWAGVAYRLADDYRVVTYDLPGHGASPLLTDVTLESIARGVLEIADELGAERFHYAGVSISGATALTLATIAPERLHSVTAVACGDFFGGAERWDQRIEEVRKYGTRGLIPDTVDRWFAAGFIDEDNAAGPIVLEMLGNVDDAGYIECCKGLASYDLRDSVSRITVPTLLMAGAQDPGNTPESMEELHERIENSEFVVVPDAAHIPMAEHPEIVTDHLASFLARTSEEY
ncbi:alpha/beta fold hydrolase [Brevibacterium samyangense]|uniref:AB hydrolase-1 domain-containing protein n=1 Tax=Brevibacterium samyangense TaxID=366888 RepID=A0ABN2TB50_9MICO